VKSSNRLRCSSRSLCVRLGGASLACALAFACNGQLEVGESEPPPESSAGAAGSDSSNESQGGSSTGGTSKGGAATGGISMSPAMGGSGGFGAGAANGAAVGSGGTPEPPPEEVGVIQGGSSEGCPEQQPATLEACVDESLVCGYRTPSGNYDECDCSEVKEGELGWNCVRNFLSFGRGCPTEKPKHGESCFGSFGSQCDYPERTTCSCSSEIQTWECQDGSVPDHLTHPESVEPEAPIDELTDEQRNDWCSWYTQAMTGPGFPPPADVPVDAEGYTTNSGCSFSYGFPCRASWPQLSARQCAQNLALSACAAPIAELSDCIATLRSGCQPSPHGCARYLEKPDCAGTIVLRGYSTDEAMMMPDRVSECPLRVE
jgi:hypothetical protein